MTEYQNGRFLGYVVEYIRELEQRLQFRCNFITPKSIGLKGFEEIINYLDSCSKGDNTCDFELAAGGFAINSNRLAKVDYPVAFDSTSFSVVTSTDNIETGGDAVFFLETFDFTTRCCLGALSIPVFITLAWVAGRDMKRNKDIASQKHVIERFFRGVISSLLACGTSLDSKLSVNDSCSVSTLTKD